MFSITKQCYDYAKSAIKKLASIFRRRFFPVSVHDIPVEP